MQDCGDGRLWWAGFGVGGRVARGAGARPLRAAQGRAALHARGPARHQRLQEGRSLRNSFTASILMIEQHNLRPPSESLSQNLVYNFSFIILLLSFFVISLFTISLICPLVHIVYTYLPYLIRISNCQPSLVY